MLHLSSEGALLTFIVSFAPRRRPAAASFVNALLATALLRCWHILLFYGFWATAVTVVSHNWYDLSIKPIMLTAYVINQPPQLLCK